MRIKTPFLEIELSDRDLNVLKQGFKNNKGKYDAKEFNNFLICLPKTIIQNNIFSVITNWISSLAPLFPVISVLLLYLVSVGDFTNYMFLKYTLVAIAVILIITSFVWMIYYCLFPALSAIADLIKYFKDKHKK